MLLKSPENYITCLLTARVRTGVWRVTLMKIWWLGCDDLEIIRKFISSSSSNWLRFKIGSDFFYNTVGLINALIEQLEEKLLILSGGFTKWFGSCWTALKFSCKDLPTLRDDCGVCINTEGWRARVYQVHHNNGLMIQLCQSSRQARTGNVCQNLK